MKTLIQRLERDIKVALSSISVDVDIMVRPWTSDRGIARTPICLSIYEEHALTNRAKTV